MTGTPALAAALAKFQAAMPTVAKSHTAKVPTKAGSSYSYTYADLADVTEAAMPLLTSHGLSYTAEPDVTERGLILRGVLMHESGEERTGTLPLSGNTPQELGSSITYMRRYLFGCLTGIVTDDDDDGSLAQKATRAPAQRRQTTPASPPPTTGSPGVTKAQQGKLFALFTQKGIPEDQQKAGIEHIVGHPIEHRTSLTAAEFDTVIKQLESLPDVTP